MSKTVRESNGGFLIGFLSAFILIAVLAGAARAAVWISSHPMPDALIAWLTAPRISVFDLFTLAVLLMFAWAVIYMAAFGPRMR